jgi:hypothetical protein
MYCTVDEIKERVKNFLAAEYLQGEHMETHELYKLAFNICDLEKRIWEWLFQSASCTKKIKLYSSGFGSKGHVQDGLADMEICTEKIAEIFHVARDRKGCMLGLSLAVPVMQEKLVRYYTVSDVPFEVVKDAINSMLDAIEQEKLKYGVDAVNAFKRQKLERLQKRLDNSE